MKKSILTAIVVCFLMPGLIIAQKGRKKKMSKDEKKALEYYEKVFDVETAYFKETKAPAEFEDESYVVLGQKIQMSLLRDVGGNRNQTRVIYRKRILLQQASALDEFSEFYFQESEALGITLTKPSGEEADIDLSAAVKVETDVPDFYKDRFHSDNYLKIAIPNIEVGDVIDFFKVFKEGYDNNVELILPVQYSYPVVAQEIIIDVDKLWTVFHDSYNGAPQFKLMSEGGFDKNGRQRKSVKRLRFYDEMGAALEYERWSYPLRTIPHIKLMVIPPDNSLSDKKNQVKNGIEAEDLFVDKMESVGYLSGQIAKLLESRTKDLKIKKLKDAEATDMIYKSMAFYGLSDSNGMEEDDIKNNTLRARSRDYAIFKDDLFVRTFATLLDNQDIDCELVMIMPKFNGPFNNVLASDEVYCGVYVPATKKYYWQLDMYTSPGDMPVGIEGAKGVKGAYSKFFKKKRRKLVPMEIPYSSYKENLSIATHNITVKDDNSLSFESNLTLEGLYKNRYERMFLYHTDFVEESLMAVSTEKAQKKYRERKEKVAKKMKGKSKKKRKKNAQVDESEAEYVKERQEILESWISDQFKSPEDQTFELVSDGINNKQLSLNHTFNSKEYLKKAGPNLVLDLGMLISEQVELSDEQINERTRDVDFSYAKRLTNDITINLPAGLKANGLDQFNMSVDNAAGSFISSATQSGDKLVVKTEKNYKKNSMPLSEWKNMVEFLEAAYQFSQKKVILKK